MLFIAILWGLIGITTTYLFGVVFNHLVKTKYFKNVIINGFLLMIIVAFPVNLARNFLHINNITTIMWLTILFSIVCLASIYLIIKNKIYANFYNSLKENKYLILNIVFYLVIAIIISDATQKIIFASGYDDFYYMKSFKSAGELNWHLLGYSPTELISGPILIITYPFNYFSNINIDLFYKVSVVIFYGTIMGNIFGDFWKKFVKKHNIAFFLFLLLILTPLLLGVPIINQVSKIFTRLHFGSTLVSGFNIYLTYIIYLLMFNKSKKEKYNKYDYIYMIIFTFIATFCLNPQQVYQSGFITIIICLDLLYVKYIGTEVKEKYREIVRLIFTPAAILIIFFSLNNIFNSKNHFPILPEFLYYGYYIFYVPTLITLFALLAITFAFMKKVNTFFRLYFLVIPIFLNLTLFFKDSLYSFLNFNSYGLNFVLEFTLHRIGTIYLLFLSIYIVYLVVEHINSKYYLFVAIAGLGYLYIRDFQSTGIGLVYNYITISAQNNYLDQTVFAGKIMDDNVMELEEIIRNIPMDDRYRDVCIPDADISILMHDTFFGKNKNVGIVGYNVIAQNSIYTLKEQLETVDNPGSHRFLSLAYLSTFPKYVLFTEDLLVLKDNKLVFKNPENVKTVWNDGYEAINKLLPQLNDKYKVIFYKNAPMWKATPTIMLEKK